MAEEWVGVIQTTAPKYLKGAADLTVRERLLLALLQQRGRITFNNNSFEQNWDVEYAQPPVEAFGDGGTLNFSRNDLYRQARLDWRGYKATDMMTRKERGMNAGDVAIINRYDRIMPNLMKAIKDKFGAELYVDGTAGGNENRLHGTKSWSAQTSCTATDKIAKPGATYAGRSTAVAQGGTWTTALATKPNASIASDWPDGNGDSEYDYYSPKLVNYSANNWGTSSTSWEDNGERVIRKAVQWLTLGGGQEARPDIIMLAGDLFFGYQNKQSTKQRIVVPYKPAEDLGFAGSMQQEGVGLQQEFDCPTASGYCFNLDKMELASLFEDLFHSQGPDYDPRSDAWLFHVGFFGNLKFISPKWFAELKNYA